MIGSPLSRTGELWVTTLGLGYMRPFSGTWGSMPTVAVAGLVILLAGAPVFGTWAFASYHIVMIGLLIFSSLGCILYGSAAEARYREKDPTNVVADETAGQCLPLLFLPASAYASWERIGLTLFVAFVLFRVLDILKPWPAKGLQRHPAGWGILLDDLASGLQALAIMQVGVRLLWP